MTMKSTSGNGLKMAGPLLRGGEIAVAALDAIEIDNPNKHIVVDDHRTYVRVEANGGVIIRKKTMEEVHGISTLGSEQPKARLLRELRRGHWGIDEVLAVGDKTSQKTPGRQPRRLSQLRHNASRSAVTIVTVAQQKGAVRRPARLGARPIFL